jgi:hypothetical protein
MEDDLKILNVEYLSYHWSDLLQFINLSSGDQTKVYRSLKLKMTTHKKLDYMSNHFFDLIQILKLS